jgi:hypothetical protein
MNRLVVLGGSLLASGMAIQLAGSSGGQCPYPACGGLTILGNDASIALILVGSLILVWRFALRSKSYRNIKGGRPITAVFFGIAIASVLGPFPSSVSNVLIVVEVPLLACSLLIVGKGGASFSGLLSGILQTFMKSGMLPFDLALGATFGISMDAIGYIFGIGLHRKNFGIARVVGAVCLASLVPGESFAYLFLSLDMSPWIVASNYSVTQLLESFYLPILAWSILAGFIAGILARNEWLSNARKYMISTKPMAKQTRICSTK